MCFYYQLKLATICLAMIRNIYLETANDTHQLGVDIGRILRGGEVLELVGDIGAGKTSLVKGIACGFGVKENVQSPSYTIASHYKASHDRELHHYDFYRLNDPGIMAYDLHESLNDESVVTAIEWAQTVEGILPEQRLLRITLSPEGGGRRISFNDPNQLLHQLKLGE